MTMRTTCLTIALSLLSLTAISRNNVASVKGSLRENNNKPIPYATVILKNVADSTLYKGEINNENGDFNIENVQTGSYFLEIHLSGFSTLTQSNIAVDGSSSVINLGILTLKTSTSELGTV